MMQELEGETALMEGDQKNSKGLLNSIWPFAS